MLLHPHSTYTETTTSEETSNLYHILHTPKTYNVYVTPDDVKNNVNETQWDNKAKMLNLMVTYSNTNMIQNGMKTVWCALSI